MQNLKQEKSFSRFRPNQIHVVFYSDHLNLVMRFQIRFFMSHSKHMPNELNQHFCPKNSIPTCAVGALHYI